MGIEGQPSHEAPVRASEVVLGVLAALAIEEIVQGTIKTIYKEGGAYSARDFINLVAFSFVLVLTVLRHFHGASAYFSRRYRRWSHVEVRRNSLVAMPVAHFIDIVFQLLIFAGLVAAAHFIEADSTLDATTKTMWLPTGVGIAWLTWVLLSARGDPALDERTMQKWLLQNLLIAACLLFAPILLKAALPEWRGGIMALVFGLAFVGDYLANYDHYFASDGVPSIELEQATQPIVYLTAFLNDAAARPTGQQPAATAEVLSGHLAAMFAFFMEAEENREALFHRRPAYLHAGLYVESGATLIPVFRYYDPPIQPRNRRFDLGKGHLGDAFVQVRDNPRLAVMNPRSEKRLLLHRDGHEDVEANSWYRSSVISGLFWRDEPQAFGVLVLTSSEEEFFLPRVHQWLAVALAREAVRRIARMFPDADAQGVRKLLVEMCKSPMAITSSLRREAS